MLGLCVMLALTGCPYSSVYFLDSNPENRIDETYLGKWKGEIVTTKGETNTVQVEIGKIDDYNYELMFTGKFFTKPSKKKRCFILNLFKKKEVVPPPTEDTIRASAFLSYVDNHEVMNITINQLNYFAEVIVKDNQLTLLPISEGFSTKLILSDYELRESLKFHYKSNRFPSYDEPMCLRNMTRVGLP